MLDHSERSGLLLALAGFACLSFGDAIIKTMSGEWSPIAVAALRFTFGAAGLSVLLYRSEGGRAFAPSRPWLQVARGVCLAGATLLFFSSIFVMPLGEATALVFVAPIFVALLSGPLLGERVRPAVWLASLVAFGGVLLVLRPNVAALGWIACLPLAAALFMALLVIANRASASRGSPLAMQAYMACVAAPILIVAALAAKGTGADLFAFGWPDWTVVARCAAVAVTASTAHWLVFLGTTRAGASTIAPCTYIQMLVAVTLGWWWFGDVPDLATVGGAAIIIGAGLFLWYRGARAVSATKGGVQLKP